MDFQRLFLFLIFSFSAVLLWDGWQRYQHQDSSAISSSTISADKSNLQQASSNENHPTELAKIIEKPSNEQGHKIIVRTDNFLVEINTLGGDIQRVELL